jgi:GTP-binding protein
MRVHSAEFVTSATGPEGWPTRRLPEVAFVGRSNVGKSSMINALCERRKLVRVSNTPGRTRLLNFFEVALDLGAGRRAQLRLCDLPGYGYAKVSKAERRDWQKMIEAYVEQREGLCAVVCIVDANVGPTEDDLQVIGWVRSAGRQVIVAATKIDKLPKHRRIPRTREVEKALGLETGGAIGVSSVEGIQLDKLWEKILERCGSGA